MALENLSNRELIEICKKDPINEQALTQFYKRFHEPVSQFIFKWCKILKIKESDHQLRETVKDLRQQIFFKLVESNRACFKNFENKSDDSIYAYLATAAKHQVMSYLSYLKAQKRDANVVSIDAPVSGISADRSGTYGEFIKTEIHDTMLELAYRDRMEELEVDLSRILKGRHRDRDIIIFKLRAFYGMSFDEITKIQGIDFSQKEPVETEGIEFSSGEVDEIRKMSLSKKRILNRYKEIVNMLIKVHH